MSEATGRAPTVRRDRARRSRARRGVAATILLAWLAGLGALAHREYFRPASERLREAALRVTPGAVYFRVTQGPEQLGFASSTIDTIPATDSTPSRIIVNDYFVADLPVAGRLRRTAGRSTVRLSRSLVLQDFAVQLQSETGPFIVRGKPSGDTSLTIIIAANDQKPDTALLSLNGPVLLPTLVPLAVVLGEKPKVGRRYTLSVFDPTALGPRDVTVHIAAESLFVVSDSARFDRTTRRWASAHDDTVRAWRLTTEGGSGFSAWVDEQGRLVQMAPAAGLELRRAAYEIAFQNWRMDNAGRKRTSVAADQDIYENTAIGAGSRLHDREYNRLVARLGNVDLGGFDLAGDRQTLVGNTLTVQREPMPLDDPGYRLPNRDRAFAAQFAPTLRAEPLLQSEDWQIVKLAARIAEGESDPRIVAQRLNQWVHDSLKKEITVGIPNALQVLNARRGDCNEHTQLYLALARASGIPARSAAGLAYVDGKFYYHAWPEVWLGRWVAVDPTFGEFPADAAHLRFVIGGLSRQAELLRLMGTLQIDVAQAK